MVYCICSRSIEYLLRKIVSVFANIDRRKKQYNFLLLYWKEQKSQICNNEIKGGTDL